MDYLEVFLGLVCWEKDYQSLEIVFLFICTFVDKATEYTENGKLKNANSLYS